MLIIIDNEFSNILPPLSDEEYEMLEQSILEEGCRNPIVTWNNTIIDGHYRYEICCKHNLRFDLYNMDRFKNREEVLEWIKNNNRTRRQA